MKVTKAQVQENHDRIVKTASRLFRERGYDGVGVADLMEAAGFTHGGFYKHFRSKADLMAEATACGFLQTVEENGDIDPGEFVDHYVSRAHRDERGNGCPLAALSGDAARQPAEIKAAFAAGIETFLAALGDAHGASEQPGPGLARAEAIDLLARAVGAVMLSRACPDDAPLADEILAVCRAELRGSLGK